MSSLHLVEISTTLSKTQFESLVSKNDAKVALQDLINYLTGVKGGIYRALIGLASGAVQASGTLTVSSTGSTAAQACTVCNVTLTGRTSTTTMNEFNVNTDPATQAAAMAACINASTDLANKVTATSLLGVVTITAVIPGLAGNGLQLSAGNLSNVALVAFANGANGDTLVINES